MLVSLFAAGQLVHLGMESLRALAYLPVALTLAAVTLWLCQLVNGGGDGHINQYQGGMCISGT